MELRHCTTTQLSVVLVLRCFRSRSGSGGPEGVTPGRLHRLCQSLGVCSTLESGRDECKGPATQVHLESPKVRQGTQHHPRPPRVTQVPRVTQHHSGSPSDHSVSHPGSHSGFASSRPVHFTF